MPMQFSKRGTSLDYGESMFVFCILVAILDLLTPYTIERKETSSRCTENPKVALGLHHIHYWWLEERCLEVDWLNPKFSLIVLWFIYYCIVYYHDKSLNLGYRNETCYSYLCCTFLRFGSVIYSLYLHCSSSSILSCIRPVPTRNVDKALWLISRIKNHY